MEPDQRAVALGDGGVGGRNWPGGLSTQVHPARPWHGKRIKFRAEGIYSKAEVWVNGHRMGSHDGGATPVELDISAAAKPGAENLLTILVTDHSDADDLSAMSFYAHFNLGGIWRPLELFCVEPAHIARLAVETRFDSATTTPSWS